MNYRITSRTESEVDEIWTHVAQDSVEVADRLEDELHAAFRLLFRLPGIGHRRPEVSDARYRFWAVGPYIIAYRVEAKVVVVVRVVHGARDFRRMFG